MVITLNFQAFQQIKFREWQTLKLEFNFRRSIHSRYKISPENHPKSAARHRKR